MNIEEFSIVNIEEKDLGLIISDKNNSYVIIDIHICEDDEYYNEVLIITEDEYNELKDNNIQSSLEDFETLKKINWIDAKNYNIINKEIKNGIKKQYNFN